MDIETTLAKAALMRMACYTPMAGQGATVAQRKRQAELATLLEAQMPIQYLRPMGGFALEQDISAPITLQLTTADIADLATFAGNAQWPQGIARGSAIETALFELLDELPEWHQKAQAMDNLARLTPDEKKALLENE